MLRLLTNNAKRAFSYTNVSAVTTTAQSVFARSISSFWAPQNPTSFPIAANISINRWLTPAPICNGLLQSGTVASATSEFRPPVRTVTKFSLINGKRKTVKAVIKRFKRLDWGIWIRTHSGRNKKLFKKSPALKRRLRQHIFTNATQSMLLDKMVTKFWRRPKHYIDDPYEPYHKRDEYFATKSKTLKI